jgi:hypothetical protein
MVVVYNFDMNDEIGASKRKHVWGIIIFLSIPVVVVIILAVVLSLPGWMANPRYDFIYSQCWACYGDKEYVVGEDGFIEKEDPYGQSDYEDLFYYDVGSNVAREISFEEARRYKLDVFSRSPDGYALKYESGYSGGWFGVYSDGRWNLVNGWYEKEANIDYSNIVFLGWVVRDEGLGYE